MSKIVDGSRETLEVAKCDHKFRYIGPHRWTEGVVGICMRCKCRFIAWPGTAHYEEIVAARDAKSEPA